MQPSTDLRQELDRARCRIEELEHELERRSAADADLRLSEEKYRSLVESSPYCIKLMDGDGRLLSMNKSGLEMINETRESDIVGRHYMLVVCGRDHDRVANLLERALHGEPSEFEFLATVGRYFRSNFVPVEVVNGRATRLLSITQDITDQRRLVDELDHRVKNNLASVLAMSQETARTAASLDQFMASFDGRIHAMARAHEELARSHWRGLGLHSLVYSAVHASASSSASRVRITGDDLLLPPYVCGPLALTLNELTTNAIKHGALSVPEGTVAITATSQPDHVLTLRWEETGGPVPGDCRPGVGIGLIHGFVEHELTGSLEINCRQDGLVAQITISVAPPIPSPAERGDAAAIVDVTRTSERQRQDEPEPH